MSQKQLTLLMPDLDSLSGHFKSSEQELFRKSLKELCEQARTHALEELQVPHVGEKSEVIDKHGTHIEVERFPAHGYAKDGSHHMRAGRLNFRITAISDCLKFQTEDDLQRLCLKVFRSRWDGSSTHGCVRHAAYFGTIMSITLAIHKGRPYTCLTDSRKTSYYSYMAGLAPYNGEDYEMLKEIAERCKIEFLPERYRRR